MDASNISFAPQWLSDQTSIVEPDVFSGKIPVKDALLCFSGDIYSRLVAAFGLGEGEESPRLAGSLKGKLDEQIAVFQACFGGPAAGMLMEALVASGVKRFWMVGQAGAISPHCSIGDLFLPTWGIREEGTSYHYLPADVRCEVSKDLLGQLKGYLGERKLVEGGVWTTDAPFRETMDKVQRYAGQGALAVEMECTALMAIAMHRRVAFAAALVITDELYQGIWAPGFDDPEVLRTQDVLCRALAEAFHP